MKSMLMRQRLNAPCPKSAGRNGSLTLLVLICLIVCFGLLSGRVRAVLLQHRHLTKMHAVRQCDWLLRAGVQRARRSFQSSGESTSEVWTPDGLLAVKGARVLITKIEDQNTPIQVKVTAEWPIQPIHAVTESESVIPSDVIQRSHTFEIVGVQPVSKQESSDASNTIDDVSSQPLTSQASEENEQ